MSSNNRLRFDGLEELKRDLRRLPADLRDDGGAIVEDFATRAAEALRSLYPRVSGFLADHVIVSRGSGAGLFGVISIVKNTAPHASLFEYGTQARHTDLGWDRGAAPPGHIFVPTIQRFRFAMYEALKGLLERVGLEVSGRAA